MVRFVVMMFLDTALGEKADALDPASTQSVPGRHTKGFEQQEGSPDFGAPFS
jgi:hypothetical protein